MSIETPQGAWMAAVGAVGAAVIGTLIMWPVMKRYLRKYDEAQIIIPVANGEAGGKDVANGQRYQDVEEDK